jgi:hypothetical protein
MFAAPEQLTSGACSLEAGEAVAAAGLDAYPAARACCMFQNA